MNWHRSDGVQAWHPVGEVQEAAAFAEHLRNAEGVEATRIYRLEQVGFAFKPYFRVELEAPGAAPAPAPPPPSEPEPEPAAAVATERVSIPVPAPPTVAEADVDGVNGSRRGLFGR